jgi:lysozyme family protein
MSLFELAIPTVLQHEGGFVNDINDPGGATNFGISLYWLKASGIISQDGFLSDVNHDGRIDINDIKALTPATAEQYYRAMWWNHYSFGNFLVQEVATKIFDTAVNMGGIPTIKLAQKAVNILGGKLVVDGLLGMNTFKAINDVEPTKLLIYFREIQEAYYYSLVVVNPALQKFLRGWLNRADS